MTGFGSVRWSDAMNQLILIALPTLPVLVTGAGEQARIASSNFSRPTSQPAHAASLYHSLENQVMFTCCIRYNIDPDKLVALREYARAWISLINKYRGLHHGYFIPGTARDNLPIAGFSFPGLGIEGPPNVAVAIFTFPSLETFERYRMAVSEDELYKAATARFDETKCFIQYERTFLVPMF